MRVYVTPVLSNGEQKNCLDEDGHRQSCRCQQMTDTPIGRLRLTCLVNKDNGDPHRAEDNRLEQMQYVLEYLYRRTVAGREVDLLYRFGFVESNSNCNCYNNGMIID